MDSTDWLQHLDQQLWSARLRQLREELRQGKVSAAQQSPQKEVEPADLLTQPARLSHPVKKRLYV